MTIYCTKQTIERYGLTGITTPIKETENPLMEWGAKIFYFNGKKCLQLCNFASKFTLLLFDVRKNKIGNIRSTMEHHLVELYKHDPEMLSVLIHMLASDNGLLFAPLKDKRVIATLNALQSHLEFDDNRLLRRINLHPDPELEAGRWANFDFIVTDKIDDKTQYIFPARRFRELVLASSTCPREG